MDGADFYPYFTTKSTSNVIWDKKSTNTEGKILIEVKYSDNKAWDIEGSKVKSIYFKKHGNKNQLFNVIHIARDVVAIESDIGGCLQYDGQDNRF